jgi:hypothetical protein
MQASLHGQRSRLQELLGLSGGPLPCKAQGPRVDDWFDVSHRRWHIRYELLHDHVWSAAQGKMEPVKAIC